MIVVVGSVGSCSETELRDFTKGNPLSLVTIITVFFYFLCLFSVHPAGDNVNYLYETIAFLIYDC